MPYKTPMTTMDRTLLITELTRLIKIGEAVDIETYGRLNGYSRTKTNSDLSKGDWAKLQIGKRAIYIKK